MVELLKGSYVLAAILAIAGCVAVDSRVAQETPATNSLNSLNGRYENTPSYRSSKMGFVGPSDLGEVFSAPLMGTDNRPTIGNHNVDTVSLALTSDRALIVTLERAGTPVAKRIITVEDGLHVSGDTLVLGQADCGGADTAQLGCAKKTTTIFVNSAGNLVIAESGGGAGFVTILPAAVYAKLMSIFPRVH